MTEITGNFTLSDYCACKGCGQSVSPSQCISFGQMVLSDNREYVVGFTCWNCAEWIAHPKVDTTATPSTSK